MKVMSDPVDPKLRRRFIDWMLAKGYSVRTADKFLACGAENNVNLPEDALLIVRNPSGGFTVSPLTESVAPARLQTLENELAIARREASDAKEQLQKAQEKWGALQGLLNSEKLV